MTRRNRRSETLRRTAERLRRTGTPPTRLSRTRSWVAAAVLAGLSAVIAGMITNAGSATQDYIKNLFHNGDNTKSPTGPSAAIKVTVVPEESAGKLASERRITKVSEKKLLKDPYSATPKSFEELHKRLGSTDVAGNFYKLEITNTSTSTIKVVNVYPVVTKRSPPLSTTLIEPIGGAGPGATPVDLDLNKHHPKFTQHGIPYFTKESHALAVGGNFEMLVEATVSNYYVEYHLKVDYIDSRGNVHSISTYDPSKAVGILRLSGALPANSYKDYWGVDNESTRASLKLLTAEEKRERS